MGSKSGSLRGLGRGRGRSKGYGGSEERGRGCCRRKIDGKERLWEVAGDAEGGGYGEGVVVVTVEVEAGKGVLMGKVK